MESPAGSGHREEAVLGVIAGSPGKPPRIRISAGNSLRVAFHDSRF
ncbi:MAG: hypothetical protein HUU41_17155 [Bryobacteraceae bacterium]|nr:hypothetical protein [Bryobacteraceae bacterium]